MRGIDYRPDTLIDLEHIALRTEASWGANQAKAYLADIGAAIGRAAENPFLGSDRSDIRSGYRKMRSGSHAIYYRVFADRIDVIRVLHQGMDVESRLR